MTCYTQTCDCTVSINANHCFYSAAETAVIAFVYCCDCACQISIQQLEGGCVGHNCLHTFIQRFFVLCSNRSSGYFGYNTQNTGCDSGDKQQNDRGFNYCFRVHAYFASFVLGSAPKIVGSVNLSIRGTQQFIIRIE